MECTPFRDFAKRTSVGVVQTEAQCSECGAWVVIGTDLPPFPSPCPNCGKPAHGVGLRDLKGEN